MLTRLSSGRLLYRHCAWSNGLSMNMAKNRPHMVRSAFASNLATILSNEIIEEKSNDQIDKEALDIKNQIMKTFSIKEEVGYSKVQLFASMKTEKISITFNVQNVDEDDSFPEYDEESLGEEESPDPQSSPMIGFEAVIGRGEERLVFNCVAASTLRINNVQVCL